MIIVYICLILITLLSKNLFNEEKLVALAFFLFVWISTRQLSEMASQTLSNNNNRIHNTIVSHLNSNKSHLESVSLAMKEQTKENKDLPDVSNSFKINSNQLTSTRSIVLTLKKLMLLEREYSEKKSRLREKTQSLSSSGQF